MISNLAYIHPDAKIGNNVTVEPFAYIAGDVVIGDGLSLIHISNQWADGRANWQTEGLAGRRTGGPTD